MRNGRKKITRIHVSHVNRRASWFAVGRCLIRRGVAQQQIATMHHVGLNFQDGAEHAQRSPVPRPSNMVDDKPARTKSMIFRIGVDRVRNEREIVR